MAGPLNGLGTGQQVPLATTFQPGQNAVRPEENTKQQDNTVKPRGSDAAGSQRTETGNQNATRTRQTSHPANDRDSDSGASQRRGSVVDITV